MKYRIATIAAAGLLWAGGAAIATTASARDFFSVSIGLPGLAVGYANRGYYAPAPVYYAPPVAYAPEPYYYSAPAAVYAPEPYYYSAAAVYAPEPYYYGAPVAYAAPAYYGPRIVYGRPHYRPYYHARYWNR